MPVPLSTVPHQVATLYHTKQPVYHTLELAARRFDPFIPCLPLHRATATDCFLRQLFCPPPRLLHAGRGKNVEFTRNRLQRPAGSIRESRQTFAFVQNHRDRGKPVHLNFVICKNELLPCWHIQTTECEHRGDLFDTRAKI